MLFVLAQLSCWSLIWALKNHWSKLGEKEIIMLRGGRGHWEEGEAIGRREGPLGGGRDHWEKEGTIGRREGPLGEGRG